MNFLEEDPKAEKRRYPRISYKEPVQFTAGNSPNSYGSLSFDISERGMRLQVNDFLPVHSRVVLEVPMIELHNTKIATLTGKVIWVQRLRWSDQYQVGVEFKDLETEIKLREAMSQFIKTHQT